MTFDFYKTKTYQDLGGVNNKDLLMVRHGKPKNETHWEQFDDSIFNKDDVVLLIDGDWLAFSTSSKEMERFVEFDHNGVTHKFFGCFTEMRKFCERVGIEYEPSKGLKKQYNHPKALEFAKSSCKKKIRNAIQATGATKVVIFCGSTGNHRDSLPLPKLDDNHFFNYKGQREPEWIPETLKPLKKWLMENWLSHWAVGEETDDCITITKKSLDIRGIKCFIRGVDKDFNGEKIGGLYIIGHQDEPKYFEDTPENRLGWVEATKTEGGGEKLKGHGDMFLVAQILTVDDADNYSAKKALKVLGTLKTFSNTKCEKYLSQFKSERELWQGAVDHFKKYLPESFTYTDCFGNRVESDPIDFLNLYYKCAKMREYKEHIPDVIEDRLKPLGVDFE